MIHRCYSNKMTSRRMRYLGCSVNLAWSRATEFKKWMLENNWNESLRLDKDILFPGNKEYGPDTCALVPHYVNASIVLPDSSDSFLPYGVTYQSVYKDDPRPAIKRYQVRCCTGGPDSFRRHLGSFSCSMEAHKVWQLAKIESLDNTLSHYSKESCYRKDVVDAIEFRIAMILSDLNLGIETKSFK